MSWINIENVSSSVIRGLIILTGGLVIGFYSGCNHGQNRANMDYLKRLKIEQINGHFGRKYAILYDKNGERKYAVGLNDLMELDDSIPKLSSNNGLRYDH